MRRDARVAVADEALRHAVRADDGAQRRVRQLHRAVRGASNGEALQLRQPVDVHLDGVVAALGARQPADRIGRPVHARLLRQRQRHQQARRQLLAVLVALARVARQHVLLDVGRHAVPLEALLQLRQHAVASAVRARRRCRVAPPGCASSAPHRRHAHASFLVEQQAAVGVRVRGRRLQPALVFLVSRCCPAHRAHQRLCWCGRLPLWRALAWLRTVVVVLRESVLLARCRCGCCRRRRCHAPPRSSRASLRLSLRRCSRCCARAPATRGLPKLSTADRRQRHREHLLEVAVARALRGCSRDCCQLRRRLLRHLRQRRLGRLLLLPRAVFLLCCFFCLGAAWKRQ